MELLVIMGAVIMDIARTVRCVDAGLLIVGLSPTSRPAARAGEGGPMPRYRLSPGQELTYRSVTISDKGGKSVYNVDWKIWVVGAEAGGSWRLVLRCDVRTERSAPGGQKAEVEPVETLVWRCRLFDDGRLVGATTMGTVRDPFRLFPRLPDDAAALDRGWESPGPEIEQSRFHYRAISRPTPDHPDLVLAMTIDGPQDKVDVLTHTTRATFDTRRGLATRIEAEDTRGHGNKGTAKGTITLVSVEDRGAAWTGQFGREAETYFAADDSYDAATERAGRDAKACQPLLAEAKTHLDEARAALTTPVFLEAIGTKLKGHDQTATRIAEEVARRARFLDKPAAEWEAKDLDGMTHRLADYRGKVVILDFWYRGCGWCMYAMPQVNRVAEIFRDQPVAVLGMTIDDDVKDGRAVVEAMGLRYPVIQARELPEKFGVQGYPTLIVIDQHGTLRDIHSGYSPRLFEELSDRVRGLLAEKAAAR
jgi:thiol-disulfide isomerase/thioredoxin